MKKLKTLVPNDFRDFLSIISFVGFIGFFLKFTLDKPFLSNNIDSVFLILGGCGLLVLGKVFDIGKWARDGIQKNESLQLFAVVFGLTSVVLGVMMSMNLGIPTDYRKIVGILGLFPSLFIFIDYLAKNN